MMKPKKPLAADLYSSKKHVTHTESKNLILKLALKKIDLQRFRFGYTVHIHVDFRQELSANMI